MSIAYIISFYFRFVNKMHYKIAQKITKFVFILR